MGRPKFQIDYEQVEKLAKIHCTQEEIASILGCSVDTLQRDDKFCGVYKNGISNGKMSLRRKQWAAVEEGNTTMLIWLGKQYLGQREPPKETQEDDEPAPPVEVHFHVKEPVSDIKITNAKT